MYSFAKIMRVGVSKRSTTERHGNPLRRKGEKKVLKYSRRFVSIPDPSDRRVHNESERVRFVADDFLLSAKRVEGVVRPTVKSRTGISRSNLT